MAGTVPTALKNRIAQAEGNANQPSQGEQQNQPQGQPAGGNQQPVQQGQQPQGQPQGQPAGGAQPPADGAGDRVTLSRAEVEQLRGFEAAAQQARLEAERARDKIQALEQRLTEAPAPAKGDTQQGSTQNQQPTQSQQEAVLKYETQPEELTEAEKKEFGETENSFVTKIATAVAAREIRTILPQIETMIQQALGAAKNATGTVDTMRKNTFKSQIEASLKTPLDTFVRTPEWSTFLQEADDNTGFTHEQILSTHISRGNSEHAAKIYRKFLDKRGSQQNQENTQSGYAGANPTGAASVTPVENAAPNTLKYSDHKKAHQQYIKKEITWDDYKKVQDEFDKAEREGRIDFNS